MRRISYGLIAAAMVASGAAIGKLPAPTPEEQAKKAAEKEKQDAQVQQEKALLERAQDRVVARYKQDGKASGGRSAGRTSDENMPKTTKEPPQGVGPRPELPQSAEAHSGGAK